jgi:hypothetical protein
MRNESKQYHHHQTTMTTTTSPAQLLLLIFRLIPVIPSLIWFTIYLLFPSRHQQILNYQQKLVEQFLKKLGVRHTTTTTTSPLFEHHREDNINKSTTVQQPSPPDIITILNNTFSDQLWVENVGVPLSIVLHVSVVMYGLIATIVEGHNVLIMKSGPPILITILSGYFLHRFREQIIIQPNQVRKYFQIMSIGMSTVYVIISAFMEASILAPSIVSVKRAVLFRAIINLFIFESVIDSLVALIGIAGPGITAFCVEGQFSWAYQILEQLISLIILTILITLTSIRGRMYVIVKRVMNRAQYRDSSIKLVGTMIGAVTVFFTLYATLSKNPPQLLLYPLKTIVLACHGFITLIVWFWAGEMEISLSPATIHETWQRKLNVLFIDSLPLILQISVILVVTLIVSMPSQQVVAIMIVFSISISFMIVSSTMLSLIWFGNDNNNNRGGGSGGEKNHIKINYFRNLRYSETLARILSVVVCGIQLGIIIFVPTYNSNINSNNLGHVNYHHLGKGQERFTYSTNDTYILLLSLLRVLILTLNRFMPFSDLCYYTVMLSTVSVIMAESSSTILLSLMLSALQFLMGLEVNLTRRPIVLTIVSNLGAQGFVDHALKQKFVGCLDAVDVVIGKHADELSDEQYTLLKNVKRACSFGLNLTYYYTILRRYGQLQNNFGNQFRILTLYQITEEWKHSWGDEIEWVPPKHPSILPPQQSSHKIISTTQDYAIRMQWNLVQMVLHKILGQNLLDLVITYSLHLDELANNENGRIEFVICNRKNASTTTVQQQQQQQPFKQRRFKRFEDRNGSEYIIDPRIVQVLRASSELRNDGYELCISFAVDEHALVLVKDIDAAVAAAAAAAATTTVGNNTSSSRTITGNNNSQQRHDGISSAIPIKFPHGLVFAILDDVKLVRLNVLRYLINELHASPQTFAMGATKQEAIVDFIEQCLKQQVDVILIDQNLEYEHELVLGTFIAHELRKNGFQGTIMLHSANDVTIPGVIGGGVGEEVVDVNNQQNVIINGFMEKRAFDRKYVESCICKAIMDNNNRRRRWGNSNNKVINNSGHNGSGSGGGGDDDGQVEVI